jgi:hypothetical protein
MDCSIQYERPRRSSSTELGLGMSRETRVDSVSPARQDGEAEAEIYSSMNL